VTSGDLYAFEKMVLKKKGFDEKMNIFMKKGGEIE
jgi:hypothetical protein